MKSLYRTMQTWLMLGLLVTVSSCKKNLNKLPQPAVDSVSTVAPVFNGSLITRYEYAPNLYTLFSYNSAGQVTGITDINDIARTDYTITYKINGHVDRITLPSGYWKFTYTSDNLLAEADSYTTGIPAVQAYYKFVYNGAQLMQSLLYSNYGTGVIQPRSRIDFQYNANGDIEKSTTWLWDLITGSYSMAGYALYESDAQPDPVYWMRDIFDVLYRVIGPHNYTKSESFYPDGSIDQNNTYNFTYNTDGYPTSAIRANLAAGPNGFETLKFAYR